jgi:DNA primase
MGTSISAMQAELLAHHFRRVVVMLDGDEFGRDATGKVIAQLVAAEIEDIDVVMLPKGEQPDTVSVEELRRFLKVPNVIYRWSVIEEAEPVSA